MKNAYEIKGGISRWDEGLPLGNGRIGCLVYGLSDLRFSIDALSLWDLRPAPETKEKDFNYASLVKYERENWARHQSLFDDCYAHVYPTKLSAGAIVFRRRSDGDTPVFSLDMTKAIGRVRTLGGKYEIFICADQPVGVLKVPSDAGWEFDVPAYLSRKETERGLEYPPAEIGTDGDFRYTLQRTRTDDCFGLLVKEQRRRNGKTLYFTVWEGKNEKARNEAARLLNKAAKKGTQNLFATHKAYWEEYYAQATLTTGDEAFDRYYLKAQYLFASSSRKGGYPMPLQGVWTADDGNLPPWKGDYHSDINLQMSYEAYLKAGHFSEGRVLCDYLWNNRGEYENFAKNFYGAAGYMIPGVSSPDGKPLGGWGMYALNPAMAIWTAKCFEEYYAYTGDEKFFSEKAYPFLSCVADAVCELLKEDENGRVGFPLSVSPEYHEGEKEAYLPSQSNFELALLRFLFSVTESYAAKAGDRGKEKKYGSFRRRLFSYDYAKNADGTMRVCREEDFSFSHRHFSHLLAICPFHEIGRSEKAEILRNVEKMESLGTSGWTGFSYASFAEICAYAGEGNRAYRYLRDYLEGFTAKNGFHLNGDYKNFGYSGLHYRPFTLEAVFGWCKALQDMFLADADGITEIFPAMPEKWRNASFFRLRARGGIEVSARRENGKTVYISFLSDRDTTVCIRNNFGGRKVVFSGGCAEKTEKGIFELRLQKGRFCEASFL